MVMAGSSIVSCPRTLVFMRLMVSPKSLQASEKWSISACSSCWLWVITAASSANSMSLMRASRTFVLALRWPRLKSLHLIWSSARFPLILCQKRVSRAGQRRFQRALGLGHSLVWWHCRCQRAWKTILLVVALCHGCSLLFGCSLIPMHPMRMADCGGTAPYWLGAAQLEAGNSCPARSNCWLVVNIKHDTPWVCQ